MRNVLFIMGGGPRIAYGVGSAWALRRIGIEFEYVIGVSMGALIGSFFLDDSLEKALEYLRYSHHKTKYLPLNASEMIDVLWGKKLISNHSNLRIVATTNDGQPELLDSTRRAYLATMCIPGLTTNRATYIEGKTYRDGSFNPLPVEVIAKLCGFGTVFVLPNRPVITSAVPSLKELQWGLRAGIRLPLGLILKALTKPLLFQKAVKSAPDLGLDVKIIWPEGPEIDAFEEDPEVLLDAANTAARSTFKAFNQEPIVFPGLNSS